jgi:hypothetical protein
METTIELQEQAKKLTGQITDYINTFSNEEKTDSFIKAMKTEHPSLQQSTARMFLEFLDHAASPDYRVDGRNEGTQKTAQLLKRGFVLALLEKNKNEGINVSEEQIEKNWDVYKPSKWLSYI